MKATVENRPVNSQASPQEYVAPEVNIFETKDGYILEAEMPGVNKEGLEVTLEGSEIAITGHRKVLSPGGTPVFRERNDADFRRVFELDPAIDTGKISAKMDQGILTLTLPKSERVKPRKITVA
ncbi:MAG TPA: Hsp20/alpha crystallin family protein [Verrucomicrobiae bacterium]|nr:Hsp20/alpha crystallin family protein [Verrucomicrobiae bacterium]